MTLSDILARQQAERGSELNLGVISFFWNERDHPRDILGRFKDKINDASVGDQVITPNKVKITKLNNGITRGPDADTIKIEYGNLTDYRRFTDELEEQDAVEDLAKTAIAWETSLEQRPWTIQAKSILAERYPEIVGGQADPDAADDPYSPESRAEAGQAWQPGYWGKGFLVLGTNDQGVYIPTAVTWPVNKNGNPHHTEMYWNFRNDWNVMTGGRGQLEPIDYYNTIWIAPDGAFTQAAWINSNGVPSVQNAQQHMLDYDDNNGANVWPASPVELYKDPQVNRLMRADWFKYLRWVDPDRWVVTYWSDQKNRGFGHARNLDQGLSEEEALLLDQTLVEEITHEERFLLAQELSTSIEVPDLALNLDQELEQEIEAGLTHEEKLDLSRVPRFRPYLHPRDIFGRFREVFRSDEDGFFDPIDGGRPETKGGAPNQPRYPYFNKVEGAKTPTYEINMDKINMEVDGEPYDLGPDRHEYFSRLPVIYDINRNEVFIGTEGTDHQSLIDTMVRDGIEVDPKTQIQFEAWRNELKTNTFQLEDLGINPSVIENIVKESMDAFYANPPDQVRRRKREPLKDPDDLFDQIHGTEADRGRVFDYRQPFLMTPDGELVMGYPGQHHEDLDRETVAERLGLTPGQTEGDAYWEAITPYEGHVLDHPEHGKAVQWPQVILNEDPEDRPKESDVLDQAQAVKEAEWITILNDELKITGFHGRTKDEFEEWNGAPLFVGDQSLAEAYAEGNEVYRVEFDSKNPLIITTGEQNDEIMEQAKDFKTEGRNWNYTIADWAKAQGYDAIIVDPQTIVYDPELREWKAPDGEEWGDKHQEAWESLSGTWGEPQQIILDPERAEIERLREKPREKPPGHARTIAEILERKDREQKDENKSVENQPETDPNEDGISDFVTYSDGPIEIDYFDNTNLDPETDEKRWGHLGGNYRMPAFYDMNANKIYLGAPSSVHGGLLVRLSHEGVAGFRGYYADERGMISRELPDFVIPFEWDPKNQDAQWGYEGQRLKQNPYLLERMGIDLDSPVFDKINESLATMPLNRSGRAEPPPESPYEEANAILESMGDDEDGNPIEPWEAGHWGKGFVDDKGRPVIWKVRNDVEEDEFGSGEDNGAPHHTGVYDDYPTAYYTDPIIVSPDGTYANANYDKFTRHYDGSSAEIPDIKIEPEDHPGLTKRMTDTEAFVRQFRYRGTVIDLQSEDDPAWERDPTETPDVYESAWRLPNQENWERVQGTDVPTFILTGPEDAESDVDDDLMNRVPLLYKPDYNMVLVGEQGNHHEDLYAMSGTTAGERDVQAELWDGYEEVRYNEYNPPSEEAKAALEQAVEVLHRPGGPGSPPIIESLETPDDNLHPVPDAPLPTYRYGEDSEGRIPFIAAADGRVFVGESGHEHQDMYNVLRDEYGIELLNTGEFQGAATEEGVRSQNAGDWFVDVWVPVDQSRTVDPEHIDRIRESVKMAMNQEPPRDSPEAPDDSEPGPDSDLRRAQDAGAIIETVEGTTLPTFKVDTAGTGVFQDETPILYRNDAVWIGNKGHTHGDLYHELDIEPGDNDIQAMGDGSFVKFNDYDEISEELKDDIRRSWTTATGDTWYWEQREKEGVDTAYRGQHQAPGADEAPAWDLEQAAPDIYSPNGFRYYRTGAEVEDRESWAAIEKMQNDPDAMVTIYRASPEGEINPGDWVTLSRTYAENHVMHFEDPGQDQPIWKADVPARTLNWDGNSINEFGYNGVRIDRPSAISEMISILDNDQMPALPGEDERLPIEYYVNEDKFFIGGTMHFELNHLVEQKVGHKPDGPVVQAQINGLGDNWYSVAANDYKLEALGINRDRFYDMLDDAVRQVYPGIELDVDDTQALMNQPAPNPKPGTFRQVANRDGFTLFTYIEELSREEQEEIWEQAQRNFPADAETFTRRPVIVALSDVEGSTAPVEVVVGQSGQWHSQLLDEVQWDAHLPQATYLSDGQVLWNDYALENYGVNERVKKQIEKIIRLVPTDLTEI